MEELIQIKNLKKYFTTRKGKVHAVDGVNMVIPKCNTMGIVGESGCGKSTLGRVLVHLEKATDGEILFDGKEVTRLSGKALHTYRNRVQIIYQDPYSSLNPHYTVNETIREALLMSGRCTRGELEERTLKIMDLVGIAKRQRQAYPHEMDGGRRQRVGIARALAFEPDFIVCDEPVSALDVSVQAQILNLLKDLQEEKKLTYMFITHDLSVVRHISDSISVMYLGQLVETSPAKELFKKQYHPYTKALLSAVPSINIHRKSERIILRGEITSPIDPKPGCRFASRCNYACEACHQPQKLEEIAPGRFVACCRAKELAQERV